MAGIALYTIVQRRPTLELYENSDRGGLITHAPAGSAVYSGHAMALRITKMRTGCQKTCQIKVSTSKKLAKRAICGVRSPLLELLIIQKRRAPCNEVC
jgi:hypothetical protein